MRGPLDSQGDLVRNPRFTFRLIIVAQALLGILAGWQSQAGRTSLPSPLREYAMGQPDPSGAELWLGSFFLILSIVLTVGTFRFWPPARPLYAVSFVLAFLAAPALPPVVQSPLASALQLSCTALAGFIIALMYFDPSVAAQFDRSRGAASAETAVGEQAV
jgi:hypothetical protein